MKIVITLIKIAVLIILLLFVFAGGVCVVLGTSEPAIAGIGLVSILLFGWPAWLIGKSLLCTDDPEDKDNAHPTDPTP
ncbi:hypothetical protein [Zoogloea sp. LCSB751]|uniref:hypothetical protein n=1 Tax=Zoogloea sp. LCSB751 TaxID=1965277 RepID=UPI0009A47ACF|nr:hypothetical protein [Zoogloea sp. LCSB751]